MKNEHTYKYAVICGAKAHFNQYGNHDMTVSYSKQPHGTDISFYERNSYASHAYGIKSISVDEKFNLADEQIPINDKDIIFTKSQLKKLYAWLNHQPWGKILVKSAKNNTIKLNPEQIHNIIKF